MTAHGIRTVRSRWTPVDRTERLVAEMSMAHVSLTIGKEEVVTVAQESTQTVQRFYAAGGQRSIVDGVMSQDVMWDITPGFLRGGVYENLESVFAFLRLNAQEFAGLAAVPEQYFADDEGHVTVLGYYAVEAKDGRTARVRFHHIWTLRDGKIVRLDQVADSLILDQVHEI